MDEDEKMIFENKTSDTIVYIKYGFISEDTISSPFAIDNIGVDLVLKEHESKKIKIKEYGRYWIALSFGREIEDKYPSCFVDVNGECSFSFEKKDFRYMMRLGGECSPSVFK